MQTDPMEMWRQLTRNYAEMSEGELVNLAEDFGDLTEMARQALRDEMRKRGLGDPGDYAPGNEGTARHQGRLPSAADGEDGPSDEFVWKNVLCQCGSREEAWQVRETLKRAGIDNWADGQQSLYTPLPDMGAGGQKIRILVASDNLEAARAVLSDPIPPDIVEQSKAEGQMYEPPVCPGCGAADPVLENVDPVNAWKCEVCGKEWTEAAEAGSPAAPPG
jgi:hypothetical protein